MREIEKSVGRGTTLMSKSRVPQREREKKQIKIPVWDILFRMVGILIARAVPIAGIAPFGVAFLAMERRFSAKCLISAAAVILGYSTLGEWTALRYIAASIIYTGFLFFLERKESLSLKGAVASAVVIMTLADLMGMLWTGVSVVGFLVLAFDLILTPLGIFALNRCRGLLNQGRVVSPGREEKRGVCIILAVALLGLAGIRLPFGFSVGNVFGYMLTGLGGISGGMISGILYGLGSGALLGLKGELMQYIAIFGVCGLASGGFGRYGKYFGAAAFALSGIILTAYGEWEGAQLLQMYEPVVAGAVLAVLPDKIYAGAKKYTDFGFVINTADNPYREHFKSRLEQTSASFKTLADIFSGLSDKPDHMDIQDIAMLFDTAADRVCKECPRVKECWKKDFNNTYNTMFRFLEVMEKKGILEERDADPRFAGKCVRLDSLIKEINRLFEVYKINGIWKSKLRENQELAGEQFGQISDIFKNMSEELDQSTSFDTLAAAELACRLKDRGIKSKNIMISVSDDRWEARLQVYSCGEKEITGVIPGVLKNVLGIPFSQAGQEIYNGDGYINLQYIQAPIIKISVGFCGAGKGEESGDAHMLRELKGGKYLAAISDGMGTGHPASIESNAIVELLESFMDAGFDRNMAVKLINSVMVMKSAGDAFATVDMCMIDLYKGEAEFIKNGAEASYIKRKSGTEAVRSASLPVGVLSDVETESFIHKLSCGDTVVMVSDGLEIKNGHEGWLRKSLEELSPDMDEKEMAEYIMEKSVILKGGVADDDMTVIVLRLTAA